MRRTVLVLGVALAACGGTDSSGMECSPSQSIAGDHAMSIEGECQGGTLTIAEAPYPGAPCSRLLSATWTCGTRSGTTCSGSSFRFENSYMELALCDGPRQFWYSGPVVDAFSF